MDLGRAGIGQTAEADRGQCNQQSAAHRFSPLDADSFAQA
jgi:hypothetical protein